MGLNYKCPECGTSLGYEGLCWRCKAKHKREEINNWTLQEIEDKKKQVIEKLKTLDDEFYKTDEWDIFHDLMTVGADCSEISKVALENNIFYPSELYYKASEKITDELIEKLINAESSDEGSQLLRCVAMAGGKKAQDILHELKVNPKPWRKSLYVDSDVYAEEAGWTFDEGNNYIKLNYDKCYSFELGDKKDENGTFIGRERGERCPHCGCELIDILVIDGKDERFSFLGLDGIITASCCPNCVTFATDGISNRFTLDGKNEILEYEGMEENYYRDEEIESLVNNRFVVSEKERHVFYGAYGDDVNTIGGFASWVQDWEYRECPECGKKMKYLAQIHWGTIEDCAEGTLYIEICPECKIVTMFHQQT